MTVAEELEENGEAKLSCFKSENGWILELWIEEFEDNDDVDWDFTHSIIMDYYEVITVDGELEADLNYSIFNMDGKIFKLKTDNEYEKMKFISLLTDWDEDGTITVPDEPYDKGNFKIPEGTYHIYTKES